MVKRKLLLLVGLKVSDKAKDYYRVGVLKSGMHTAVLKEINSTYKLLYGGNIRCV
jgi:hypothetical protein